MERGAYAMRPAKVCPEPGCRKLNCTVHTASRRSDQHRSDATQRGYDRQWKKVRAIKISMDPLCEVCKHRGRVTAGEEVHHIMPVRTHPELRTTVSNLMTCCRSCHRELESRGLEACTRDPQTVDTMGVR